MSDSANSKGQSRHTGYWIVGAVAAVVSAATVAYVFYARAKSLRPQVESVQQLLDRCHDQVKVIEEKIAHLNEFTASELTSRAQAS